MIGWIKSLMRWVLRRCPDCGGAVVDRSTVPERECAEKCGWSGYA